MTKSNTPLLSLGASGSVADLLTYQRRPPTKYSRKKPIPTDMQTLPQLYRRWLYQDYIAHWNTLTISQKAAYRKGASINHMTPMAYYLSIYLKHLTDIFAWWKLDIIASGLTSDASKNQLPGTVFGTSPIDAVIAGGLHFDGIDDRIDCGIPSPTKPSSALTLQCWIRNPNNGMFINQSQAITPGDGFMLGDHPIDGFINFRIMLPANTLLSTARAPLLDGKWHLLTATWDGSDMFLYFDAVQQATQPAVGTLTYTASHLTLGARWRGHWDAFLSGDMDNPLILYRALTQPQIELCSERSYPL